MITVNGVSPKTHFAQVMVEADYRMKLIGIGLETPPVRLVSYVDRAKPSESAATPCSAGSSCPTTSASARATTSWRWNWSATA